MPESAQWNVSLIFERRLWAAVLLAAILFIAGQANAPIAAGNQSDQPAVLAPIWDVSIQRWSAQIAIVADAYGLDPDLVAAVINAESNGQPDVVSHAGAVGLMGVMPTGPGLEWRPSAEELANPNINLRWGAAILSQIIRQSGGDISAALAAYSGGWDQATKRVPQEYAARALDEYGRAVAYRSGVSPEIAGQWTVAVRVEKGNIPNQPLIMGQQPLSGLRAYGEHIVYHYVDRRGQALHIVGYAVPLTLLVPLEDDQAHFISPDELEPELMAQLGLIHLKEHDSNPRVILACLPSLSRLRGHASTRWYAPSDCPKWHR